MPRSTGCCARRGASTTSRPSRSPTRELRALYELAKWGPTTANSQPQRVVFVRSAEAKERLAPALSSQNQQEGARRAGGGDPRLRHALLRAPAAAVPQSAGAELVRDHAGGDPHHGAAQRHAAGRLSDAGGARDRARLRPDVGLQERRGGCRVLPRRPFQVEFPVLPRPRRSVDLAETGLSFRASTRSARSSSPARAWRGSAAPGTAASSPPRRCEASCPARSC